MKRFNFTNVIIILVTLIFFSSNFNLHAVKKSKRSQPSLQDFYKRVKGEVVEKKKKVLKKQKPDIEGRELKKKTELSLAGEASVMSAALKQWIRSKKTRAVIGMTEDERKEELGKQTLARQIKEISDESEEIKGRLKPMTELEEKIKRNEKDLEKYSKKKEELEDEVGKAKEEAEEKSEEYKQWILRVKESKTELSENIDAVKKYLDASGSGKEALTDFIDTLRWSDSSVKDDFSERVRIFIIEDPLETNIERMKKQLDSSSIHLGVNNFIDESGEPKSKELKEIERKVGLLKSKLSKLTKEIDIRQEEVSKDKKTLDEIERDKRVRADKKRLEYNQKEVKALQDLQTKMGDESKKLKTEIEKQEKERVLRNVSFSELRKIDVLSDSKEELKDKQKKLTQAQESLRRESDPNMKGIFRYDINDYEKEIKELKTDIKTQEKEVKKIIKEAKRGKTKKLIEEEKELEDDKKAKAEAEKVVEQKPRDVEKERMDLRLVDIRLQKEMAEGKKRVQDLVINLRSLNEDLAVQKGMLDVVYKESGRAKEEGQVKFLKEETRRLELEVARLDDQIKIAEKEQDTTKVRIKEIDKSLAKNKTTLKKLEKEIEQAKKDSVKEGFEKNISSLREQLKKIDEGIIKKQKRREISISKMEQKAFTREIEELRTQGKRYKEMLAKDEERLKELAPTPPPSFKEDLREKAKKEKEEELLKKSLQDLEKLLQGLDKPLSGAAAGG